MNHNSNACIACGAALYDARSHARFCSSRCRKRWSRRKEVVNRESQDALYHVRQLRRLLKDYPDLRAYINDQLRFIRQEAQDVLLLHDPQTQQENAERNELLIGMMRRR